MNRICLYCYNELGDEQGEQGEYHQQCAVDLFGSREGVLDQRFAVKKASADDTYSPALEAVTMRLAAAAMILTTPCSLYRNGEGNIEFIIRKHQNIETIEQLTARLDDCFFDGSVEMIAELVEDFSSISRLDVVNLFEQILFGWITANDDFGAHSLALVRPNDGVCSLSPILSARGTLPLDQSLEHDFPLSINFKRSKICRKDFEAAMRHMGLKDRIIRITIDKMIGAKESWEKIIDSSPLAATDKEQYKRIISERLAALSK